MHICLVYNEYPKETDNGGIATYQFNMAKALQNEKNKITVIASSLESNQNYIENGIKIIRLKNNLMGTLDEQLDYRNRVFKIIQEIDKNDKIDIIETPEIGAEALICVRKGTIPVIVKLHTSYKLWSQLNGQLLDDKTHKEMIKWEIEQLNKADAIISCSNLLKEIVEKDIKRRDINVIPNPINTDMFYFTNIRKNSHKILYCGSLEYRKGILVLIKAIPLIIEKLGKEVEFELIGKDSLYNGKSMIKIIYEVLPQKFHSNLKIQEFISKEKLNIEYNKATIGVIPSLFDNLPYVALEALLTKLPIVVSDNTGLSEILDKENAGIIFENGNYKQLAEKVVELYTNKNKASELGNNGRRLVLKTFSADKIAKVMIKNIIMLLKNIKWERGYNMHICLINFEYPKETTVGGIGLYQKRNAENKIDVIEVPDLGAEGIIFQKSEDIDYYSLRNAWLLYITKVIYEKLYFYELGYIDIESKEHKKDYWKWWVGILKNQNLFDELYFEDFQIEKINNGIHIKNEEKSFVQIVESGKSKFILKKTKINKDENANVERKILNLLSLNIKVPRILKIKKYKSYIYKLYTYQKGEHKIRYTLNDEQNLIINFKKLNNELSKINVETQIGDLKKKVLSLKKITNNNFYKECLDKLLCDKEFITNIHTEKKQIIHDDLHSNNILFDKNSVIFLDFDGIKKYPKSLQIASFITNFYLYQGEINKLENIFNELNVENKKYIFNLIIYRMIKTLIYFEKNAINQNNKLKEERIYSTLKKIIKIKEEKIWN